MLNEHDNDDTSKICPESLPFPEVAQDDFATKAERAKEAVAAVKANENSGLDLAMVAGEKLTILHAATVRGQWGKTLKDIEVSASSSSIYTRLYESRDDVQDALDWAVETGHPSAHRRRVPEVLKLIGDWKKAQQGGSVPAPAPKARQKPHETIADLRQRLEHAEGKLVRMGDVLSLELEDDARVMEVLALAAANDTTAIEKLAGLAQRYHRCLRDLVAIQTCNVLQVSESADPRPGAAETDAGIDEAGGATDHGDVQDFPRVDAAPSAAQPDLGAAAPLDDDRPGGGDRVHKLSRENTSVNTLPRQGMRDDVVVSKTLLHNANRDTSPRRGLVAGNEF